MFAGGKEIKQPNKPSDGPNSFEFEAGQWLAHRVKGQFYDLDAEIIAADLESKEGKEPSVTLRYCDSFEIITKKASELFKTIRENIKTGMRLITSKEKGGIMPEDVGSIFDFKAGQRIVVSGGEMFRELASVIEVKESPGGMLVKLRYGTYSDGYGTPRKEIWVDARDLSAEILINKTDHWKLLEDGKEVEIESYAALLDSQTKVLGEELKNAQDKFDPAKKVNFILSEAIKSMRETRDALQKDYESWRAVQLEAGEINYRLDRLGTAIGNLTEGGNFIADEDDIGREENVKRLGEIEDLDRRIDAYSKALEGLGNVKEADEVVAKVELEAGFGHLKRAAQGDDWQRTLDAYAVLQLTHLKYHPQVRSPMLDRINQMIALGLIATPLRAVATSSDLTLIENDVRIYNDELSTEIGVGGGPKLSAGYGIISMNEFAGEWARLSGLENEMGEKVMGRMDAAAKIARPLVKENRGSSSVAKTVAVGAWDVLNDPSTMIMFLAGVGFAGPMWFGTKAALIAEGVTAGRAAVLATAMSGLVFHAANSTINLGLNQLPGVDRSDHIDYTPEGFLRSTAMMFTLGGAQSLYGNTLKPYLRFLSERPALQAVLNGVGEKTFEIAGLAGFNIGAGTIQNGWDALSPDNMYRELLSSVEFVIAFSAMHAGRHGGRKGPAQEGYERAVERWAKAKENSAPDDEFKRLGRNVIAAFDAAQRERLQAHKHNLSLGKEKVEDIKKLIAQQKKNCNHSRAYRK